MRNLLVCAVMGSLLTAATVLSSGCGGAATSKDTLEDGLAGDAADGAGQGGGELLLPDGHSDAGTDLIPAPDGAWDNVQVPDEEDATAPETDGSGGDAPGDAVPDVVFDSCQGNSDCESGFCVAGPDGKVCAIPCVEECPTGWLCTQVQTQPDVLFVCIWPHGRLCWPCNVNEDCLAPGGMGESYCVPGGIAGELDPGEGPGEPGPEAGAGTCATQCEGDETCPSGYSCLETGVGSETKSLCRPEEACTCAQAAVTAGAWSTCSVANELGTCPGKRQCMEPGQPAECDAPQAQAETCNDVDDDCDGTVDEGGANGCTEYLTDLDQDGFGKDVLGCYCDVPEQGTLIAGDCDDGNPASYPGAEELCNTSDDDCDGTVDEAGTTGCMSLYADTDEDGFGAGDAECLCAGSTGYVAQAGDCAPDDPAISPASNELCNAADDDCDGSIDEESPADCTTFYADEDSDGVGLASKFQCLCQPQPPYSALLAGDCDDQDPGVAGGAAETCDGKDNDCDGTVDEVDAQGCQVLFVDSDLDGYGSSQTACACPLTAGYSQETGDCNDQQIHVHPGALEICNGIDDDCNGNLDPEGASGCILYYPDGDGDGFGSLDSPGKCLCKPEPAFPTLDHSDCDDADPVVLPGGTEQCNGKDDNCDGKTDPPGLPGCLVLYKDSDGDGYGDKKTVPQCLCLAQDDYSVTNNLDCNDASAAIKPGANEKCDGVDNDCDDVTDPPEIPGCKAYFKDLDGDGFGDDAQPSKCLCAPAFPYTAGGQGDCNDGNVTVPSCAGKECGDDGCGKTCASCSGSYFCSNFKCEPDVMVRADGTCLTGYLSAGKWYTGPGKIDGQEEGRGYLQEFVDVGWMTLCTKDPAKYRVEVSSDDCAAYHPFLGCPAGFKEGGRFHVGKVGDGQPWCWMESGHGYTNGTIKAGWMVLCVKNGVNTADVLVYEHDCPNTLYVGCGAGKQEVGIWHTSNAACDGQNEAICANGSSDNGWVGLCVWK